MYHDVNKPCYVQYSYCLALEAEASETMSLKELFLSKAASVRHLGHRDVRVINTTAIDNKNNGCVYSELSNELKPPSLRVRD